MSVPVHLLPLHLLKQDQQAQFHLFTYFLLTIIVLFSRYSPITNLQKFELRGDRRTIHGRYVRAQLSL